MTAAEKRERRQLKHDLQRKVAENHFRHWKLYATTGSLKAAAKTVADQILAGKNPAEVERL